MKQSEVSKPSTEAEFRALLTGIDEILWIRDILKDLNLLYDEPIRVLCNNKSAPSIAHDPVYHDRIKHVNIECFYIKEKL